MDIILVHLGDDLPGYIHTCIRQIRTYTDERIVVVVDKLPLFHFGLTDNIHILETRFLKKSGSWKRFEKAGHFSAFGDDFWKYACERFYAIEAAMEMLQIKKALHIENDNLIYGEIDEDYLDKKCGDNIGITRITHTLYGAGIMYVGSLVALSAFNDKMTSLMELSREDKLVKMGDEMQNEMRLMCVVAQENPDLVKLLPTTPRNESKYVYDCASWGQYIGGTHQCPSQPYTTEDHIVGKDIIDGKYDCKWIDKEPYIVDAAKNLKPLFNLHIHSKQLGIWVS